MAPASPPMAPLISIARIAVRSVLIPLQRLTDGESPVIRISYPSAVRFRRKVATTANTTTRNNPTCRRDAADSSYSSADLNMAGVCCKSPGSLNGNETKYEVKYWAT